MGLTTHNSAMMAVGTRRPTVAILVWFCNYRMGNPRHSEYGTSLAMRHGMGHCFRLSVGAEWDGVAHRSSTVHRLRRETLLIPRLGSASAMSRRKLDFEDVVVDSDDGQQELAPAAQLRSPAGKAKAEARSPEEGGQKATKCEDDEGFFVNAFGSGGGQGDGSDDEASTAAGAACGSLTSGGEGQGVPANRSAFLACLGGRRHQSQYLGMPIPPKI